MATVCFLVLFFGIVFTIKMSEGTLVVKVDEPDAEISVDGRKITLESPGRQPVEIEVVEGKHTLSVKKDGFQTFTKAFTIESRGRQVFDVKLWPVGQAVPDIGKTRESGRQALPLPIDKTTMRQAQPDLLAPPDPAAWKALLPADAPAAAIAPFDSATAKKQQQAWAEYLGVPIEREIDLGDGEKLTMVLVPPGEFVMGSTAEQQTRCLEVARAANDTWFIDRMPFEGPRHRVRITRPFRLSRHEVTRGQFRRFVEETEYQTDAERDHKSGYGILWNTDPGFEQTDDHPVLNVSWNDATAFCQWLSSRVRETHQLDSTSQPPNGALHAPYALPSEAQWEYACRAGTTTAWHCGDSDTALQEYAWFKVNSSGKTHPAGPLKPNGWGLYDMHGNVWEWCADRWARDYYAQSPSNDPSGPTKNSSRAHRGGCWHDPARYCRSAFRLYRSPEFRDILLVFRLASVLADK